MAIELSSMIYFFLNYENRTTTMRCISPTKVVEDSEVGKQNIFEIHIIAIVPDAAVLEVADHIFA